jgi:hypothetical protein
MGLHDLLLQLSIPKPEQFWPVSVVGYIEMLGFLGTTVWIIFQTGRWAEKLETHKTETKAALDGFGSRVSRMELGLEHEEGRVDALEVQMSRTQGQYEALITLLGEAKESVNQFRMGTQTLGDKIERRIDDLKRDQNDMRLELSQRLKAVETILEHQE